MNKEEWNQLFDYNSNKEMQNKRDYQNKFSKINDDLARKGQIYYKNVMAGNEAQ